MTHSYLYIYINVQSLKIHPTFLLNTNNNFCNSLKCLLNVYYSNKTKYVLFFLAHPLSSFRCGVPLSPKAGRSVAPDADPAAPPEGRPKAGSEAAPLGRQRGSAPSRPRQHAPPGKDKESHGNLAPSHPPLRGQRLSSLSNIRKWAELAWC